LPAWRIEVAKAFEDPRRKVTLSMKRVRARKPDRKQARRQRRRRVRVGAPDPRLTGFGGVTAVAEPVDKLGVVEALDAAIGPDQAAVPRRDGWAAAGRAGAVAAAGRGRAGGLDRQRTDIGVGELSAVPPVPATTAGRLARRGLTDRLVRVARARVGGRGIG
jgi:hypothetical protein